MTRTISTAAGPVPGFHATAQARAAPCIEWPFEAGPLEAVLAADFATLAGLGPRTGRLLLQAAFGRRFRQIAHDVMAFDREVGTVGPAAAMRDFARLYGSAIVVVGSNMVPSTGPVVVLANHPGLFDSFALFATAGRADLLCLARPQPLLGSLPFMRRHLILLPDTGPGRATAVRGVLRHLSGHGTVLMFPAGKLEPEPPVGPAGTDRLLPWLAGVGAYVLLAARRGIPLRVVPAAVEGVLSKRIWRLVGPLLALRRTPTERLNLATLAQVMLPRLGPTRITVRYGAALEASALIAAQPNPGGLATLLRAELGRLFEPDLGSRLRIEGG